MAAPVRVGDVLADKYEVTKILGVGGMGVVVAAYHRELDKLVALKFMHEELSANAQAVDRFLREARAAARLRNEHIGQVLDVGRLPSGVPYIVMEYLEGQDLGQLLEQHGPLPMPEAVEYVVQVCEAMAEAHVQGIIHRDLKPQNLFLATRPDGRSLVKVLDFGISKAQFGKGPTSTSQQMGSPAYMSPEQIRSAKDVDARADIWSLGVILYQLLSNTLPFDGDTILGVMFKACSEPTPSLAKVRDDLPSKLLQAIDRCLEKDRERRFANVAELAHELVPFASERSRAAIALIERVISSAHESRPMTHDELAAVSTGGANAESWLAQPPAATRTTLGAAAASVSAGESRGSQRRWMVVVTASVVVISIVAFAATRDSGSAVAPANVPAVDAFLPTVDATTIEVASRDAGIVLTDASLDTKLSQPVDAAEPAKAPSRRAPRRQPTRDAGTGPAPDALSLEPARESPVLTPARPP